MKIVHIEDFFHPNTGYQVNILAKFMARDGHNVTIITSEMEKMPKHLTAFFGTLDLDQADQNYEKQYGVQIVRVPIYRQVSGRSIYKCKVVWDLIETIRPDVLYVHGSDTYIGIRVFLKSKKIQCTIVSDNHMVDMASTNRFRFLFRFAYRLFITPIICDRKIPVIHDENIDYVVKRFCIPENLAPSVGFGTDTMLFHSDLGQRSVFRDKNSISKDAFVILYAGKLDEEKGGMLLANLACSQIPTRREVVFLIIGNTIGRYGAEVENRFRQSRYRVLRFPTQPYSALSQFYQAADIGIIAKQCSLNIYDYAGTGLPVVVEDNETNRSRINSLGEGRVFKKDDVNDFATVVSAYANMSELEFDISRRVIAENAQRLYGYEKQYRKYMAVIEKARREQMEYI